MQTININGIVSYIPQTAKELKRLSLTFSIPCNVVKYLGKYDIVYSNRFIIPANVPNISSLTLKQWYELMINNLPPELQQGEKGILYADLITKVENSTI